MASAARSALARARQRLGIGIEPHDLGIGVESLYQKGEVSGPAADLEYLVPRLDPCPCNECLEVGAPAQQLPDRIVKRQQPVVARRGHEALMRVGVLCARHLGNSNLQRRSCQRRDDGADPDPEGLSLLDDGLEAGHLQHLGRNKGGDGARTLIAHSAPTRIRLRFLYPENPEKGDLFGRSARPSYPPGYAI